jgi:hypothetical protein
MLSSENNVFELTASTEKGQEETFSYNKDVLSLPERNFSSLLELAKKRLITRGLLQRLGESDPLYNSLERGTAVLKTEDQLDKYMQAFGRKHYIKFQTLYESLPIHIFDGFLDVVDWGCGLGLGAIALDDFCRRELGRPIESQVRQVILIEPSHLALNRAKIHVELLFPESDVTQINKTFEDLVESDFPQSALGVPRLHLFSNVLDLEIFRQEQNRTQLFDLIKKSFRRDEIYLCVSPSYNDVMQRNHEFVLSMTDNDVEQETLLEPIEKIFTRETDGCDVRMTGVAVRFQSKRAQEILGRIKNKRILSELNARRDSTPAQRDLVRMISTKFTEAECDILYRPNLMGDSPDMLLLRSESKAKLIYVCDVADSNNCLTEIMRVSRMAIGLKKRLYNLLSRSLMEASSKDKSAFGLVQCIIFMPKIRMNEDDLKKMMIAELKVENKENFKSIEKDLNYLELFTGLSEWGWQKNPKMSGAVYMELKDILLPKSTAVKKEGIVTYKLTKQQKEIAVSAAGARKKVFGVFGSGKTTVMVARAISAYKRTHKMIVILCYNITLRSYIESMLLRQYGSFDRNQFYVVNYHEFINAECHSIDVHLNFNKENFYDDYSFFKNYRDKFRKYGVIFIDEAQDYSYEWFRIISDVFLADNGEYVLFGDEKQNIYGKPLDDTRKTKTNIPAKPVALTGCHRSNAEIIERVELFQKLFGNKYDSDKIECESGTITGLLGKTGIYDIADDNIEMLLKTILKIHKEYEIPYSDMTVLGSGAPFLRLCEKRFRDATACETECMFIKQEEYDEILAKYISNLSERDAKLSSLKRGLKLHFDANREVIKFSTIHSYKGFESNTIIAINQSPQEKENYSELELIYTALTRAGKNLFVINYGVTKYGEDLKRIFGVCP